MRNCFQNDWLFMLDSSATQQANGERLLEMIEVAKDQQIFDMMWDDVSSTTGVYLGFGCYF